MTSNIPGQEPQQPSYSTQQQPYSAPQSSYSAPQHPGGQQPYAAYAAYAPAPKSDKKTFGLWALILGISSIVLPLGINGIAGIVLGIVGLVKENAKGMSIGGIITGALGLIWAPFAWTIALGLLIALASYNS